MSAPAGRSGLHALAVEGVVIVASILLAFAVDAWWNSRGQREADESFVELLDADLDTNIGRLEASIDQLETRVPQMAELVRIMEFGRGGVREDSLMTLLAGPFHPAGFQPVTAAYDAATGTDAWERIPAPIRVELAAFAHVPAVTTVPEGQWALTVIARHGASSAVMGPDTRAFFGLPVEASPFDMNALLGDPDFAAWVMGTLVVQRLRLELLREWAGRLREIRERLGSF